MVFIRGPPLSAEYKGILMFDKFTTWLSSIAWLTVLATCLALISLAIVIFVGVTNMAFFFIFAAIFVILLRISDR